MATKKNQQQKTGFKKRQQIDSSSRTMFLWVAGASVIVAFALVGAIFLIQKAIFSEKVIGEKNKALSSLDTNIESYKDLTKNISKLRANRNLYLTPTGKVNGTTLDRIFDALPYEGDAPALGSSLQSSLLTGVAIETLSVDPVSVSEDAEQSVAPSVDTTAIEPVASEKFITFSFKITGTEDELKTVLGNISKSIRPIRVINLELEAATNGKVSATVDAITYYQNAKEFQLSRKEVK